MTRLLSHAIVLPLKENFSRKDSGAVSIWVNSYLQKTKFRKNIHIFCSIEPFTQSRVSGRCEA